MGKNWRNRPAQPPSQPDVGPLQKAVSFLGWLSALQAGDPAINWWGKLRYLGSGLRPGGVDELYRL